MWNITLRQQIAKWQTMNHFHENDGFLCTETHSECLDGGEWETKREKYHICERAKEMMEYRTHTHSHTHTYHQHFANIWINMLLDSLFGMKASEQDKNRAREGQNKKAKAMDVLAVWPCAIARCSEQFILAKRHTDSFWFCSIRGSMKWNDSFID